MADCFGSCIINGDQVANGPNIATTPGHPTVVVPPSMSVTNTVASTVTEGIASEGKISTNAIITIGVICGLLVIALIILTVAIVVKRQRKKYDSSDIDDGPTIRRRRLRYTGPVDSDSYTEGAYGPRSKGRWPDIRKVPRNLFRESKRGSQLRDDQLVDSRLNPFGSDPLNPGRRPFGRFFGPRGRNLFGSEDGFYGLDELGGIPGPQAQDLPPAYPGDRFAGLNEMGGSPLGGNFGSRAPSQHPGPQNSLGVRGERLPRYASPRVARPSFPLRYVFPGANEFPLENEYAQPNGYPPGYQNRPEMGSGRSASPRAQNRFREASGLPPSRPARSPRMTSARPQGEGHQPEGRHNVGVNGVPSPRGERDQRPGSHASAEGNERG
ncbi:hypothetical protein B0O99DRAFT_595034 [Bisporella sp. PMI_857]|nr:hypothetical protein B0O99DRAFT_595034 [Bisporella sp. PMI_857]